MAATRATPVTTLSMPARMSRQESIAGQIWRRFRQHRMAMFGLITIVLLFLASLFAPAIAPYNPDQVNPIARHQPPLSAGHFLGTDEIGRDVLSRLLYAGRVSLTVGFAAMVVTIIVGSLVGLCSAYYGGKTDVILMRLTDVFLSFPTIYLLLVLAAFVRPSVLTITLIVAATLQVAAAILAESYISFLGYGIQPPQASWGIMLNNAQEFFTSAPWLAVFPGVAITFSVLAFNFVGDGLRDAFDPRQRVR